MIRKSLILVAAAIAVCGGIAVTAGARSTSDTPPRPAWVRSDGSVDLDVARRTRVPVVGADGDPILLPNGDPLLVPVFGDDPATPENELDHATR
jgi:hypothetical protein